MAKDLTVTMEDRPGTAATLGEALGNAGVNIEGLCGFTVEGRGIGHILVEDAAAARAALASVEGVAVEAERDVLAIEIAEDRPGVFGALARKIAEAGVNIELTYLATGARLVLGVSDLEAARKAVEG